MSHAKQVIGVFTITALTLGASAHAREARARPARGEPGVRQGTLRSPGDRGPVNSPQRLVSRDPEEGRIPTGASAPATLIGEVRARTDRQGRLLVLVDEWRQGTSPDGVADRAFLFQSERPIEERIDERLPLASVVFRSTSLYVTSPGGGFVLDLSIGTDTVSRMTVGRVIVLHDGLALQSRIPGTELTVLDPGALESLTIVADETGAVEPQTDSCDGGGPGASTCEYSCNMSAASVTKTDQCGVTCRDGYYACCGCNMFYNATCTCVKEPVKSPKDSMHIDNY